MHLCVSAVVVVAAPEVLAVVSVTPPHLIRNINVEVRVSDFLFLKAQKKGP